MKVTIYTITDCQFSKKEKEYLTAKNVPFEEKNLETIKEFLVEMLNISNNFAGTPVTQIVKDNGQTVILKGFTPEEFDKELSADAAPSGTPIPMGVPAPMGTDMAPGPMAQAPLPTPDMTMGGTPAPALMTPPPVMEPMAPMNPAPVAPVIPPMDQPALMNTMPAPAAPSMAPSASAAPAVQQMPPNPQGYQNDPSVDAILNEMQQKAQAIQQQESVQPGVPAPQPPAANPPAGMPNVPNPTF